MKKLCSSLLLVLVTLTGCATVSYHPGDIQTPGVYHEVIKGETLWEISEIYDIDLKRIISANRLPDASKIEVGQLIFVPEAPRKVVEIDYDKTARLERFMWPVKGIVISYFGSQKSLAKNKGIDIKARRGMPVSASRSGKVTFASEHMKGYGKTIIIDHLDGFETVYAHNSENFVKENQAVRKGDVIAKVGDTGRANTPALHFEIRKSHKPQNPFYYLP